MAGAVVFEEKIEIPLKVWTLAEFRRWALSDEFPERGRIDYIGGRIEVDMSPEDIFCHSTPKSEIHAVLYGLVKERDLGHLLTDRVLVSSPVADLSCEPDVVFLSHDAIDSGRVRLVPKSSGEQGRYVEVEGPPDMVLEVVSDSSVAKDTKRLPKAYFAAGVREFWLVDARGKSVVFRVHARGDRGFRPAEPDAEGYQRSSVFPARFRLDARRDRRGNWAFDLRVRAD